MYTPKYGINLPFENQHNENKKSIVKLHGNEVKKFTKLPASIGTSCEPYLQEPATGSSPEPHESSPNPETPILKIHFPTTFRGFNQ
jgi:hypothetical protein